MELDVTYYLKRFYTLSLIYIYIYIYIYTYIHIHIYIYIHTKIDIDIHINTKKIDYNTFDKGINEKTMKCK